MIPTHKGKASSRPMNNRVSTSNGNIKLRLSINEIESRQPPTTAIVVLDHIRHLPIEQEKLGL